jgi:thiol-disulfide isomerase/thioredoxin
MLENLRVRAALMALAWGLLLPCAAWAVESAPGPGYEVQSWAARRPVPTLQATDLAGQVWRLAEMRGRVVLINFWASWCEPCRAEMPSLQRLGALHPQELVVLAVNFKEPTAKVQQFVRRTDLTLPVLQDPLGEMARAWGVTIFPSTVLIDANGKVRGVLRGELDWTGSEADRLLAPLLKTVRLRP